MWRWIWTPWIFFSDIKKRTCLFSFKATSSSWSPGFRAVHMVLWDRYGTAFWSFPMYPAFSVTSNGGFIEKGHLIWKDFIHYIKLYLKLLVKSTNSTIKSILGLAFSLSSGNGRLVATRLLIIRKSISEDKKVYKYKWIHVSILWYDLPLVPCLVEVYGFMHIGRLFLAKNPIQISPVELT